MNDESSLLDDVCDIHLSIVSHGQWPMIEQLLDDLLQLPCHTRFQVTITLNVKELCDWDVSQYPFIIKVIENPVAKGFGANHNSAFKSPPIGSQRKYFVVINPDIRIFDDVFSALTKMQLQNTGVIAPAIKSPEGVLEDSARELPTPGKIVAKLFGQRKRWDYAKDELYQPDWIAGMFMLFKAETYELMGGFNDDFFLYYEDVDLCSRLWLEGYCIVVNPGVSVVHDAQRRSHSNLNYLRWHLGSMLRFFLSGVFRRVKKFHKTRISSGD